MDESGTPNLNSDMNNAAFGDDWFTIGGIITNESGRKKFEKIHSDILTKYFARNCTALSKNFKLHYHDLRRKTPPYDILSDVERLEIADAMFDAIRNIDCSLVSVTINKRKYAKWHEKPANIMAYALLVSMKRFQSFLEDKDSEGVAYYEEFTNRMRRTVTREMERISFRTNFTGGLYKIKGRIKNGHPATDVVLQFADFFVYAPHIKSATNDHKQDRWLQVQYKYYNGGSWKKRGYVRL